MCYELHDSKISYNLIEKYYSEVYRNIYKKKITAVQNLSEKKEQKIRAVTACSVRSVLARECMYVCMRMCIC